MWVNWIVQNVIFLDKIELTFRNMGKINQDKKSY